jgi:hypothetical protein
MRASLADWVNHHSRASVLLALRAAMTSNLPGAKELAAISAERVRTFLLDPDLRLWAADVHINGASPDPTTPLSLVEMKPRQVERPFVPRDMGRLSRILGRPHSESVVHDANSVLKAWRNGQDALKALGFDNLVRLTDTVDIVVGLQCAWGEIRALSNPLAPGFVAFGVNNPAGILAEQAVHEATHVNFAARVATDPGYEGFDDDTVSVPSPFTGSLRTVERVAHGVISYSVVELLWDAIASREAPLDFLEIGDTATTQRFAAVRAAGVRDRVRLGLAALRDAGGPSVLAKMATTYEELTGRAPFWNADPAPELRRLADWSNIAPAMTDLPSVHQAEIALAADGMKASRISVPLEKAYKMALALAKHVAVVGGRWATTTITDPRLGGFSNISGEMTDILRAPPGSVAHLYLHVDPDFARMAAQQDLNDDAGDLFGIPTCCQNAFKEHWPRVSAVGGDLFGDMIRRFAKEGSCTVARECDATAMYRGGGLCWHFPCRPDCGATIQTVQQRRSALKSLNPDLLRELDRANAEVLTLAATGHYLLRASAGLGNIVVEFDNGSVKPA